jgi:hypothetical protein
MPHCSLVSAVAGVSWIWFWLISLSDGCGLSLASIFGSLSPFKHGSDDS